MTQTRRQRQRSRVVLPIVLIGVALAVVGTMAVGIYALQVDTAVNQKLQRSHDLPAESPDDPGEPPRPAKVPNSEAINYVLIGSDRRSTDNPGPARSDALMVLHLTGDRRAAYLISFPRDMYVPIPGHGKNKINAAFAFGGTALTVRTLEGLLDVRMDHVAVIDFDGFVGLTEDLGGVTVYNEHPSVSGGWAFPLGNVTIRGEQALAYVRERKQLPRGDLDRAQRHRAVVTAILNKGLSRHTLANPDQFIRFAGGAAQHITVDRELTERGLRSTVLSLRLTPDDLYSIQAPISGFGTSPTNQSIDLVDQAQLDELAAAMQNDQLDDYRTKYPDG